MFPLLIKRSYYRGLAKEEKRKTGFFCKEKETRAKACKKSVKKKGRIDRIILRKAY